MLGQWELENAERAFRAALSADSTYSRAHHDLAMTLYWQAARDRQRTSELTPQVVNHAQTAVQFIEQLPHRDSLHALAFHALGRRAHSEARRRYSGLVQTDSSDVFAWLLLGATEYTDAGTSVSDQGTVRPRANWNAATRSFLRAVDLAPHIPLGYGYLFDVYRRMAGERTGCPPFIGFGSNGEVPAVTMQATVAGDVSYFCPVYGDSLEWWTREEVAAVDRAEFGAAGEALFQMARGELDRWTRLSPTSHRPLDELSKWYVERHYRIVDTPSQALADSLAEVALYHAQVGFELVPDTTPERWIRLGALHLATGSAIDALEATESGVIALEARDGPDWEPPEEAVNVYVANGRVERAIELIRHAYRDRQIFQVDRETNATLPFAAVIPFQELRILGGLRLEGLINERFEDIEAAWDRRGYTARQRRLLRAPLLRQVAPALAHSDEFRRLWVPDDDARSPYWEPFFASDSESSEAFDRALALHDRENPSAEWTYVLGVFAADEGRHEEAIRLMSDLRSKPLPITQGSGGWAMSVMASLVEARALEAMGDARAADQYRVVVDHWAAADAVVEPLLQEAREGLERSRRTDH